MLFIVVREAFFLEAVKDLSKEEIGRKLVASEARLRFHEDMMNGVIFDTNGDGGMDLGTGPRCIANAVGFFLKGPGYPIEKAEEGRCSTER